MERRPKSDKVNHDKYLPNTDLQYSLSVNLPRTALTTLKKLPHKSHFVDPLTADDYLVRRLTSQILWRQSHTLKI